jgi:hypothetical protein
VGVCLGFVLFGVLTGSVAAARQPDVSGATRSVVVSHGRWSAGRSGPGLICEVSSHGVRHPSCPNVLPNCYGSAGLLNVYSNGDLVATQAHGSITQCTFAALLSIRVCIQTGIPNLAWTNAGCQPSSSTWVESNVKVTSIKLLGDGVTCTGIPFSVRAVLHWQINGITLGEVDSPDVDCG